MINVSTLSKLRRLVLRQNVSVREASRRLGISRNTATKWLKDGQMVEPRYPQRVSGPSILDPYKEQLSQWLKADSHRSKRDRRGIKAMFEALRAQGYSGSRGPLTRHDPAQVHPVLLAKSRSAVCLPNAESALLRSKRT